MRIFNRLAALTLLDAYAFITHARVQAGGFIGRLPQLFEIWQAHGAQILLTQHHPGQFDDTRAQAIQLAGGVGANQPAFLENSEETMGGAFMQIHTLTDIRQAKLGMGGIEAEENVNGFLNGRRP